MIVPAITSLRTPRFTLICWTYRRSIMVFSVLAENIKNFNSSETKTMLIYPATERDIVKYRRLDNTINLPYT